MNAVSLQPEPPALHIYPSEDDRALEIILPAPEVGVWVASLIGAWGDYRQRNLYGSWVTWVWPDGTIYYASDVKDYLLESWRAALGSDLVPVSKNQTPPEPIVEPAKPGLRGLVQMAREMKLDPNELYRRLESNTYDYKVTRCESYFESDNWIKGEDQGEVRASLTPQKSRSEYFFDRRAADWNIKNTKKMKGNEA